MPVIFRGPSLLQPAPHSSQPAQVHIVSGRAQCCLVESPGPRQSGQHHLFWGTLELCIGVQRIRCFLFQSDKAWKCNSKQYVAVIPPKKYTDVRFKAQTLEWKGRIFCYFQLDLALFSFLQDLKCLDAKTILQTEGGASMFYVSDKPWLCVLPINHILGRVPLMKVYLCGSCSLTIPSALSQHKLAHFRYGHADRN
jgi:hypothetical protein